MRLSADVAVAWWDGAAWKTPSGQVLGTAGSGTWTRSSADADTTDKATRYLEASGRLPVAVFASTTTVLFVDQWRQLAMYVDAEGDLPAPPHDTVVRDHARGMIGVHDSAKLVADGIVRGMRNEYLVTWARNVLSAAGVPAPRGHLSADWAAGVLFAAEKRRVAFVPDPVDTELMAPAEQILCVDPNGACLLAGDCDEQLIALGSALEACGIDVRLRVRRYEGEKQAHVTLEYLSDDGTWTCLDPSTDSGVCSNLSFAEEFTLVPKSYDPQKGIFIGLGAPVDGRLGQASQTLSAADTASWLSILSSTKSSLDKAITRLTTTSASFTKVRADLGLPQYDTASSSEASATTSPIAQYVTSHAWTSAAAAQEQKILSTAQFVSQCLGDVQAGSRALYLNNGDLLVASQSGDPYGLLMLPDSTGTPVPTYVNLQTNASTGTLGIAPIVIGIVVAVVSLASAIATWKFCDYLATAHRDDALLKIAQASVKATPEQAAQMTEALHDFESASAPPPTKNLLSALIGDHPLVSLGLAVVGGAALGFGLSRILPRAA